MHSSQWYYLFASVDYTANKSYHEYYDPQTALRITNKQGFGAANLPFSNSVQLILGGNSGGLCKPCGTMANLFLITNYYEEENILLFGNGLDSKVL